MYTKRSCYLQVSLNSGHRSKDKSMPHTGVSAPVHNCYHLVTANLHNQEEGNVRL